MLLSCIINYRLSTGREERTHLGNRGSGGGMSPLAAAASVFRTGLAVILLALFPVPGPGCILCVLVWAGVAFVCLVLPAVALHFGAATFRKTAMFCCPELPFLFLRLPAWAGPACMLVGSQRPEAPCAIGPSPKSSVKAPARTARGVRAKGGYGLCRRRTRSVLMMAGRGRHLGTRTMPTLHP